MAGAGRELGVRCQVLLGLEVREHVRREARSLYRGLELKGHPLGLRCSVTLTPGDDLMKRGCVLVQRSFILLVNISPLLVVYRFLCLRDNALLDFGDL